MSDLPNPFDQIRLAVDNAQPVEATEREHGGGGAGGGATEAEAIDDSEDLAAARLTRLLGDKALYVAAAKTWFLDDGTRYRPDETQWVEDRAREISREMSFQAGNKTAAIKIATNRFARAAVAFASTDRTHAEKLEGFDRDPWLLNTPGGTVTLRSGQVRPYTRRDRLTKLTGAAPGGEAPRWRQVLVDVTGGDLELVAYLQRVAGYNLTGSTEEHAMFFLYGSGGNGKSVFLETLADVLGDYAMSAPIDMFTVSHGERHPTELAMLRGQRLVIASETEEGRRWDEAKLKAITGGDRITARYMRQDFFTFTPTFKLVLAGNYRPSIRSVDDAMRRRINMIPFVQKIRHPDKALRERLRDEWGGILAWAIEGCLEWQRIGLAPPAAVRDATAMYFETEDVLGKWLGECCHQHAEAVSLTSELFVSFREFARENGEFVGSERRLSQMLQQRGFERWQHPKSRKRGFRGVEVRERAGGLDLSGGAGVTLQPASEPIEPANEWEH